MKTTFPVALIFAALVGEPVHAQVMAKGLIKQIYTEKSGSVVRISLDTRPVNPGACELADFYFIEYASGEARGPTLSSLLLAYSLKQEVTMWVQGCTVQRYWGGRQPAVMDVYLTAP